MAVTDTVAAVTQLALTGDVIPATWYHTIRLPNGKLDAYAILFLADFVYWHRAQEVRDPQTGQFLRFERRFFGDKYLLNYSHWLSRKRIIWIR
jgi:HD superfamily phosphohydrolase YqeK